MPTLPRIASTLASCCIASVLLTACEETTVKVNVHGVNYSRETFSYDVADPAKPDRGAGGELIDPFGAGGTTCCVILPNKWRPGIKLQVSTTHWLESTADSSAQKITEVKEVSMVDVPPYADGKPGELWVLREQNGKVSVVSSDFQPDHEKWPGKVKGWPVPSLEYQRERWELYRRHEQGGVDLYKRLIADLDKNPESQAAEAWTVAEQYDHESIKNFLGPKDPRYIAYLKKDYEEGLERSKLLLERVMEARP